MLSRQLTLTEWMERHQRLSEAPVALMSRGARLEDGGAANHEYGDDRGDRA